MLNSRAPDSEKAVALCWIFHLTGDVHQPLHVVQLFNAEFPNGDHGGGGFHVKVTPDRAAISLHSFWDDLILGSERPQSVFNEAIQLRNQAAIKRSALPELRYPNFEAWASESLRLAETTAYQGGRLPGGNTKEKAAVLPLDYRGQAKVIAERRMALAGYRLADLLARLP